MAAMEGSKRDSRGVQRARAVLRYLSCGRTDHYERALGLA